jgi:CDP-diacylglycerol---glycerol-3-phosphate 3-phosphatidyltransferase
MTIPTCITIGRLFITILMLIAFYQSSVLGYIAVLFLFSIAIISDILDGHLARKYNQVSEIGSKLDPLIDKIMMYSLLFSLFYVGVYSPLVIFSIFFRDMIADGLRNYISELSTGYGSNIWGKVKFALQSFSVCCGLLFFIDPYFEHCIFLANAFLLTALILSLPGLVYIVSDFLRIENKRRSSRLASADLEVSGVSSQIT